MSKLNNVKNNKQVEATNNTSRYQKFKQNIAVKVTAFILAVIMIMFTVVCVIGAVAMVATELYTTSKYDYLDNICAEIAMSDCTRFVSDLSIKENDKIEKYYAERNIASVHITDIKNNSTIYQYKNIEKLSENSELNFTYKFSDVIWSYVYYDDKEIDIVAEITIGINPKINDSYTQAHKFTEFAYSMQYAIYVVGGISFILSLVCFGFLMSSAGHRKGYNSIKASWITKIPLDLLTFAFIITEVLGIVLLIAIFEETVFGLAIIPILLIIVAVLISVLLGWCMSLATRIKLGKWWKNTVIYRLFVIAKRLLKFLFKKLKVLFKLFFKFLSKVPLVWKTALIVAGVSLANLILTKETYDYYYASVNYQFLLAWAVFSTVVGVAVLYCAIVLKKLQEASKALADGDLSYQVDTSKMFGDFKEYGESLNSISKGMAIAVEERMKSERMKTELITNVSHDIKTPLTSIINYTDLISKEPCDNKKINEYSSVLLRQSERLKRLIDDLVEASKASTGNLEVNLAPCEANILLTQIVGEYTEKIQNKNLELITTQPENAIMIMADGRRLWRVFDNLMNNICKYSQGGTRVYLSLEKQGSEAVITFKNTSSTALNISADELMERFVRGDSSRNTEGNGLGLSIAKSLTELQNGKLELTIDGDLFKVILKFPVIK